ncbi:reverse transcriptase domain-containing protein [Desulforapulum autotrophicum]|nr:reverse transcriptase domain-containing protein [Desulforapulum autotrophicum]
MSSGSYFPPPVLRVEIPKGDGRMRPLGIPTVSDRIAQQVVKQYLEPELEKCFHPDSYGYRPGKSALDAVGKARKNCWRYDWVLDLDIKGFFDNIDHDLLMKAVRWHTKEKWVLLYIERWLKTPIYMTDKTLVYPEKGTPQGGLCKALHNPPWGLPSVLACQLPFSITPRVRNILTKFRILPSVTRFLIDLRIIS